MESMGNQFDTSVFLNIQSIPVIIYNMEEVKMVTLDPIGSDEAKKETLEGLFLKKLTEALCNSVETGQFSPEGTEELISTVRAAIAKAESLSTPPQDHPIKKLSVESLRTMTIPVSEASVGKVLMDAFKEMDDEPRCLGDLLIHQKMLLHRLRKNREAIDQLQKVLTQNSWNTFTEEELDVIQGTYYEARNLGREVYSPYDSRGMNSRGFYNNRLV